MEQRTLQQLKKGVLDVMVLEVLTHGPLHGYGILQLLAQKTDGLFACKEGTLYPVLYRLEDAGQIKSISIASKSGGAPKKCYELTPQGRAVLSAQKQLWQKFAGCVSSFLQEEK